LVVVVALELAIAAGDGRVRALQLPRVLLLRLLLAGLCLACGKAEVV
jgi:hypothetical protein